MSIILFGILAFALLLATGARLRLWYYEGQSHRQYCEETSAISQCDAVRGKCERIWWEGQR